MDRSMVTENLVEIGRRRRPRQSRRTISGTAGAAKCLSRGSVGSRPRLGDLRKKARVARHKPMILQRNLPGFDQSGQLPNLG